MSLVILSGAGEARATGGYQTHEVLVNEADMEFHTEREKTLRTALKRILVRLRVAWLSAMLLMRVTNALPLMAVLLLACSAYAPAFAQTPVDLQLVLAVDASGSVDQRRFELQQQGYVAAFRDPRVLRAIQSGATQTIAVTMVQWTGPALQLQVLPWTLIKDVTTAHAFAAAIASTPRQLFSGGTSISGIIDFAVPLMSESQ